MSKGKLLRVKDFSCNAICPVREHTIYVHGEKHVVRFEHGKDTVLPFEQGMKFVMDGFSVEEVDGSKISLPAVATENVLSSIGADECVAKYSELTLSALKLRAAQRPGGEIYLNADDAVVGDLVNFLSGLPPVALGGREEADEIEIDEPATITPPAAQEDVKVDDQAFTETINLLLDVYGADGYFSDPESGIYQLRAADGVVVATGTIDELVAGADEALKAKEAPPAAEKPKKAKGGK